MRLVIAAVGKLKDGAERELYTRYADRIAGSGRAVALGPLDTREINESKARSRELRVADEAGRLAAKCTGATARLLLDEHGKSLSSAEFATLLRRLRDSGESEVAFLIGGADGHGEAARNTATHVISLGRMTLPHGLARIVLAEQLYRATTIISGHPYHRE